MGLGPRIALLIYTSANPRDVIGCELAQPLRKRHLGGRGVIPSLEMRLAAVLPPTASLRSPLPQTPRLPS